MSEQSASNEEKKDKCPRCGDMFYHPKEMLENEKQRAEEWEEYSNHYEKKLIDLSLASNELIACVQFTMKNVEMLESQHVKLGDSLAKVYDMLYLPEDS